MLSEPNGRYEADEHTAYMKKHNSPAHVAAAFIEAIKIEAANQAE